EPMRRVFFVLAGLLLAAVVVQFYFAAVGAFAKPQDDRSFALHDLNGMLVIPLLSLLATAAAALARAPGRLVGLAVAPGGLVAVAEGCGGADEMIQRVGCVVWGARVAAQREGFAVVGRRRVVLRGTVGDIAEDVQGAGDPLSVGMLATQFERLLAQIPGLRVAPEPGLVPADLRQRLGPPHRVGEGVEEA